MRFPIANVSIKDWNPEEDYTHYILMDPFMNKKNDALFEAFYKNQRFVDSEGNIFTIVDLKPPKAMWRRVFYFLPNAYRATFVFMKTEESMSLDQVRQFILKQVRKVKTGDNLSGWIYQIKNANSIQAILGGE